MARRATCPNRACRGTNCTPVGAKKNFKVGKAGVGAGLGYALAGPLGGVIGAASGFNGKKKVSFVCNDCGTIFELKI